MVEIYGEDSELLYEGWSDDIDSDLLEAEVTKLGGPSGPKALLAFYIYTY